jgi:endonuclease-3 related protein
MTKKTKESEKILYSIYKKLYRTFGPQHWWPGDTPFETAVGAILTQGTNWTNVEKAIKNLKRNNALSAQALNNIPLRELAACIRPAGYFNIKAKRLKAFIDFLMKNYHGSMKKMKHKDTGSLREELLSIHGIGSETADSIILYALDKPVFVIDAYTKRVLSRHGIMDYKESYDTFQGLFHAALKKDIQLFNEYHALFVKVGKTYCRRKNPMCEKCPLKSTLVNPIQQSIALFGLTLRQA